MCATISAVLFSACGSNRDLLGRDVASDPTVLRDTQPTGTDTVAMDAPAPIDDQPSQDAADVSVDRAVPAMDVVAEASIASDASDASVARDVPPVSDAGDARADAVSSDSASDSAVLSRCSPVIDGTLNAAEWSGATAVTNTVLPSVWGPNELRELRVCFDDLGLSIGVRASVEGAPAGGRANSVVMYIDRDFRGGSGGSATGISLFSALNDRSGTLDSALSADFRLGPSMVGFGVEGAFGISGMRNVTSTSADDTQGWRLFWPAGGVPDRRTDFAYVLSGVNTVCVDRAGTTDDVCESRISWAALFEGPRPATTTLAMFVRVVSGDGSMSPNQALPMDEAATPRTVDRVVTLEVR